MHILYNVYIVYITLQHYIYESESSLFFNFMLLSSSLVFIEIVYSHYIRHIQMYSYEHTFWS